MATANSGLVDALRARWTLHDVDNQLRDAFGAVESALVGDYWQWPGDPNLDRPPAGHTWLEGLEAAIDAAGQQAFDTYVVPAIAKAIIDYLPTAPADLISLQESEQLRSDLAELKGSARKQVTSSRT